MKNWSDEEIILNLQGGKTKRDLALKQLYEKLYPYIRSYIIKNNGSNEDAADIFQDGIIVFYEKVRLDQFQLTSSIRTYLYSVCKHLWLNKLRANKKVSSLANESDTLTVDPIGLTIIGSAERSEYLDQLLDVIGADCKKILIHFYFDRLKMKEIADLMNFATPQVAKNKKSNCLKKLKSIVSNSPKLKDLLS